MAIRSLRSLAYEDLSVGLSELVMKTVTDQDVVGFADISGDQNPIHLCDLYASRTRFGQRIAHGLYTASLISAVIGTKLPGPGAIYLSQSMRFRRPVKLGDAVATRWRPLRRPPTSTGSSPKLTRPPTCPTSPAR